MADSLSYFSDYSKYLQVWFLVLLLNWSIKVEKIPSLFSYCMMSLVLLKVILQK